MGRAKLNLRASAPGGASPLPALALRGALVLASVSGSWMSSTSVQEDEDEEEEGEEQHHCLLLPCEALWS